MEIEQLKLSSTQKQQITNMLQNQGLSQSDINEILNKKVGVVCPTEEIELDFRK